MELCTGTIINDRLRLLQLVGEGAMGVVWSAEHLTLNTQVAVKFLSEQLVDQNPVAFERFEREGGLAARVQSPHVVRTFDQGQTDSGRPYIVMEWLDGESLEDRLEQHGELPLPEVAQIVREIGAALAAAHAVGIVHRDVKPGNIFLMRQQKGFFCKLLDFGIAKHERVAAIAGLTEAGTIIGTPEFMSPEQLMNPSGATAAVDAWGLVVSAYCAITDRVPFEAESLGNLVVKVLNAEFVAPSHHIDGLPHSIDSFFDRALHARLAQRFPGLDELITAFEGAVNGEEIQPDPGVASGEHGVGVASNAPPLAELPASQLPMRSKGRGRATALLVLAAIVAAASVAVVRSQTGPSTATTSDPSNKPQLVEAPSGSGVRTPVLIPSGSASRVRAKSGDLPSIGSSSPAIAASESAVPTTAARGIHPKRLPLRQQPKPSEHAVGAPGPDDPGF